MTALFATTALLYALLLTAGIGGLWWHAPVNAGTAAKMIMATIVYLPLIITGIGVWLRDARLLTWLCFVLLFFFCGYVTQIVDAPMRSLALLRVTLVVLLFVVTLVYIRQLNAMSRSTQPRTKNEKNQK
jgi:uncharacterized membrane protein